MNEIQLLMFTELVQRYGSQIVSRQRGVDRIDSSTGDPITLWTINMQNGAEVRLFSTGTQAWFARYWHGPMLHRTDGPAYIGGLAGIGDDTWYIHGIAQDSVQVEKLKAALK